MLCGVAALALTSMAGAAGAAEAPAPATATAAAGAAEVQEVVVTGRFLATGAQSATKLDLSVMDTPFSVSAYTGAFMKSIETTNVSDLYRYMTGVARSGATGYDMTLRGFKTASTDRNAILVDGLPGLTVRFGSPPTVGTEHIELVKGPSSVLYGQGQPGGFVNIITKKPLQTPQLTVEAEGLGYASNWAHGNGYDASIDATGPLGANGAVLGRVIAEYGDSTGFRDHQFATPVYIAPSLTWEIGAHTQATLLVEARSTSVSFDSDLIAPLDKLSLLPKYTTSYQRAGDILKERGVGTTLLFNHDFENGVKFNLGVRDVQHKDHTTGMDVVGFADPANTRLQVRLRDVLNTRTYDFADGNFSIPFDTGAIKHKVLVGISGGQEMQDFNRLRYYTVPTTGAGSFTLDVYNPSYAGFPQESALPTTNPGAAGLKALNDPRTISKTTGAYASDFMTFTDQWKAMVGVRYSRDQQSFHEQRAPGVPDRSSDVHDVLPLAGLIYEPTSDLTLYTSYTTSFVPILASAVDVNNENHFAPTKAHSIEGGVKANLFDNRANVTAAIFDIKKTGVTSTFTVGCPAFIGTCTQQVGSEEAKGLELEVSARPIEGWSLIFGYAYTDSKVTSSPDPVTVGREATDAPKNAAHIWNRYDFSSGPLAGLGVGLGISYTGKREGLLPTTKAPDVTTLPANTLADLAFYYTLRKYQITLKISNLTDERYVESESLGNTILPGAPRQVVLAVRTTFD
ncbi:MAG: ferrichrome-iron receptor [Phenylobacterium sp.]|nr:ferrichrome-iron receptor [Phenylobacterium sp.]